MEIKLEGNVIQVKVEYDGITAPVAMRGTLKRPKAEVGIANMRARAKRFGGEVRLNSHPAETVLLVTLPLSEAAKAATA